MITIALVENISGIDEFAGKRWCYFGKDVSRRDKIASVAGEGKRVYLKDALQKKAEELKRDYTNFAAGIGKDQEDRLGWWSARFPSKSHFQTDFFLLVCYKAVIEDLLDSKSEKKDLVIFIEDPWLFEDIRSYKKFSGIRFSGGKNLKFLKLVLLAKGVLYRSLLLAWFFMAWILTYYYHGAKRPKVLDRSGHKVGIFNPSEIRTFKSGKYVDNFKPGLSDLYDNNDVPYFYIYLFNFPISTIKDVGKNRDILWPLILDLDFFDAVRSVFKRWNPKLNHALLKIGKHEVANLMERERCLEFASMGFNIRAALFNALVRFFKKGWCEPVIYVFENQPWEKVLCMAAEESGIKAIGYQHSSIWRLYFSQFIGPGEDKFAPLPHRIVTSGAYFASLYKEGGIPPDKLTVGGAWRYVHCSKDAPVNTGHSGQARPVVLVSLPIDIFIAKAMLKNVFKEISSQGMDKEIEFWIKPHPGFLKEDMNIVEELASGYQIVKKTFSELLKEVDVVMSSASTAGLEAFLYGKKAVSFIPENLFASEPLLDINDPNICKWYEGNSLNKDFLKAPFDKNGKSGELKRVYFEDVDKKVWLEIVKS